MFFLFKCKHFLKWSNFLQNFFAWVSIKTTLNRNDRFPHWMVECQSRKLQIIIIYRPPYSSNHPVTTSVFFADFSNFLESIIMSSVPLLIAGDFNIHVDVPGNADSVCLKELLESMGQCQCLSQHVNEPTHESGHTLDLIITRQCDSLLAGIPVTDCLFSDHSTLICDLTMDKPPLPKKKISFRKTKVVDINLLCDKIKNNFALYRQPWCSEWSC